MSENDFHGASVPELVSAATDGDDAAWQALIDRYEPLVRGVSKKYHLSGADLEDVIQSVWLELFTRISTLREPRALPGWLVTTTRNTALDAARASRRYVCVSAVEDEWFSDRMSSDHAGAALAPDADLMREVDRRSVRAALDELSPVQRELLLHVVADPPIPYVQIGRELGIPIGSIGPTRARCLKKLRRTEALRSVVAPDDTAA